MIMEAMKEYPNARGGVQQRRPIAVMVDWEKVPPGSYLRTRPDAARMFPPLRGGGVERSLGTTINMGEDAPFASAITVGGNLGPSEMTHVLAHEIGHAIRQQALQDMETDLKQGRPATLARTEFLDQLRKVEATPYSPDYENPDEAIANAVASNPDDWYWRGYPDYIFGLPSSRWKSDRDPQRELQETMMRLFMQRLTGQGLPSVPSGFGPTP
jgi:hypothetical protein